MTQKNTIKKSSNETLEDKNLANENLTTERMGAAVRIRNINSAKSRSDNASKKMPRIYSVSPQSTDAELVLPKYIFVTGGVVSSLGKGLAIASLGNLLQARGYKVRIKKLDPYLNIDPGTMSPMEHGEVFVTEDGTETDLDLGHYERFTGLDARKGDSISTGQIYAELLEKERKGVYLGSTVQVIPHVTDLIKKFITSDNDDYDFVLCEIGGTVGDIEGLPFFEAIRQLGYEMNKMGRMNNVSYVHLTLLPYLAGANELKTKPTQHSVKELRSIGIQPNILICRADREIPQKELKKIAGFCNIPENAVIPSVDSKIIYEVPLELHANGLDREVLLSLGMKDDRQVDLSPWYNIIKKMNNATKEINIVVAGKYTECKDAYKSLSEALIHSSITNNVKPNIKWIDTRNLNEKNIFKAMQGAHAILVPGGFGSNGINGKILATNYARTHNIPFFGICLGMQIAIIEAARNIAGLKGASSSEFGPCKYNVVAIMTEWMGATSLQKRAEQGHLGGTMRLGSYECKVSPNTKVSNIYGSLYIKERHRHRYEVNMDYCDILKEAGVIFSGMSMDGELPEIIERADHPWFVATQFHPELKSRPFSPHPLFCSFIKAALDFKKSHIC